MQGQEAPISAMGETETLISTPAADTPQEYGQQEERTGLILILGPGWVRSWAAAGVLMEVAETQQPIQKIYASEMSALISVIFAADPRPSAFSWSLQRLRDECLEPNFSPLRRLLEKAPLDASCLREFLSKELRVRSFEDLKIPVEISEPQEGPRNFVSVGPALVWSSHGSIVDAVMRGLTFPGLIQAEGEEEPGKLSCSALCAEGADVFPVRRIRASENSRLVVLDLDPSPPTKTPKQEGVARAVLADYDGRLRALSSAAREEMQDADAVLHINSPKAGSFDPKQKNEFLFLGKEAFRLQIEKWQAGSQAQLRGN
jgi:predicted acylesterase/phospholipase RssA